jgi:hypothetical protein
MKCRALFALALLTCASSIDCQYWRKTESDTDLTTLASFFGTDMSDIEATSLTCTEANTNPNGQYPLGHLFKCWKVAYSTPEQFYYYTDYMVEYTYTQTVGMCMPPTQLDGTETTCDLIKSSYEGSGLTDVQCDSVSLLQPTRLRPYNSSSRF